MQQLLRLGIGVLSGNLLDLAHHEVVILRSLERNTYQEESKKESKGQQTHHSAHAGPLPAADSNWAVTPVTRDGPQEVGGQQYKQGQRVQSHCQNVSKRSQRDGGTKKVFPIDSRRRGKLRWQSRYRQRRSRKARVRRSCLLLRCFYSSRNPYLRRTARRAKGKLPFNGMSATVTITLHIFHVTRASSSLANVQARA